jgi:hypothetical protein
MNVGDERSISCWMEETPVATASPLQSDQTCDVVVIGSGIAGLSTAYELSRFGRSVIVIDRGGIGCGMTARTTAHLATELDDFHCELIRVRGEDEARLYHDSQVAAVNRIEAICREEGIDSDFARVDGFLFPAEESHRSQLKEEYTACQKILVDVEWAERAPVPGIDTGRALRFPNQGRFHPTKYLAGLARAIVARGGRLYADTAFVSHDESNDGVEIATERGHTIRAGAAVFATNSPVNDKVTIHTKQIPDRTYAIAGRVPKGSVPDALVWDTYDAYHYVRLQPLSDTEDLIMSAARITIPAKRPTWTAAWPIWSGGRANAIRASRPSITAGRPGLGADRLHPFRGETPAAGTSTRTPAIPARASPTGSPAA